jgi:hypothetical protein
MPYHLPIKSYQSKVMIKVKVLENNAKLKGQRVKVMILNERSCQKEYTCEIKVLVSM